MTASPTGPGGPAPRQGGSGGYPDDDTHVIAMAEVPTGEPAGPEPGPGRADDYGPLPQIDPEELAGLQGDGAGVSAGFRRVLPLEDEATTLVARYLFPTERYRGEWKRHLISLLGPMTLGFTATAGLGWLSGFLAQWSDWIWTTYVLVLIWLGVMGYLAWRVADWHFDRFILTNKRVMKISGIITRKVAMMPLLRVTDMKYEQTPVGRVLNYGTFVIESAGQDQALREVPYLPRPNELYLRVVEEMYEPPPDSQPADDGEDPDAEERRVGG